MSKNSCKSVLYTQENTWFLTSANRKGEAWQQTDTGSPWLCPARLAQHLSSKPQNLPRLTEMWGEPHAFEKSLAGMRKTGEAWLSLVFCPLSQYSANCSSTSVCKFDQGLQVWFIWRLKSSRKVKYLRVWTKGRALTHHIFNQLLAEQEDCKHRAPNKGQNLHLQKCR